MSNCPNSTRLRRTSASGLATLLVVAAATWTAGCSFSWDSSGIRDVLLGGRKPAEIAAAGAPAEPGSATNADATNGATQALPPAPKPPEPSDDDAKSALRRIAVLPVAFVDAAGGGQPCDLCPPTLQMKPTNLLAARLVNGFVYEKIARHPRLLFPTPDLVDRVMAASPAHSLRQAASSLAATGKADVVVVAALLELRPRVGPDDAPTSPAGVALYASLVDAHSGKILWSDTFDRDESGRGVLLRFYDRLMNDKPVRWSTAEGYSEHAVDKLMHDLVGEVR